MLIFLFFGLLILGALAATGRLPDSRDTDYSMQPRRDRDHHGGYPA
ncbi:hypothetical protein [Jatrophihabitans sp. GAS493]|nr:hypothetical protein [Jatrophihabitans sp. GAS493]